jgi:hypothetical protein
VSYHFHSFAYISSVSQKSILVTHFLTGLHLLRVLFTFNRTSSAVIKRNVYRLLVGKPEGKRPLGRPRCRWMDNIKMDLLEIGVNVVDWIGLAQDGYRWRALVNSVMNLRVP